ncbi:MAG TPA: hypothetical protein VFE12_20560, partial [Acetobacteraceae bacterium]|nr:hypothetical protein [Acetobacteraceae bacterium]
MGGYSLLLAMRRPPLPMAEPSAPAPRPASPSAPERLGRRPQVTPASTELVKDIVRPRRVLSVDVEHIPADTPGTAGVAAFEVDTGALIDWLPILGPDGPAGRARIEVNVPAAAVWLCLAKDLELAHFGYQQRVRCGEKDGEATIDAALHAVTLVVRLGDQPAPVATLLHVEREDDPNWHMPSEMGAGEATDAGGRVHWTLPAGKYRVRPVPPADWLPVPLQVQEARELPVN